MAEFGTCIRAEKKSKPYSSCGKDEWLNSRLGFELKISGKAVAYGKECAFLPDACVMISNLDAHELLNIYRNDCFERQIIEILDLYRLFHAGCTDGIVDSYTLQISDGGEMTDFFDQIVDTFEAKPPLHSWTRQEWLYRKRI